MSEPGAGEPNPPEPGAAPGPSSRGASALVGAGILLSRLSGLVRERVIAYFLGVGVAVDAFRAALRIPNLLQNLLGEGVLSASFIPVYARLLAQGEQEEAGRVAGAIAGLLSALAGVLVVVGVVLARPLALVLTPGFTGDRLELTVTLIRILTPGIGFLVLSAWCLGILNSHRRFFLSYVAPVLWNGAQIAVLVAVAAVGVTGTSLAVALAWGTFAGGVLQFLVQVPAVRRLASPLPLSVRVDLPGVRATIGRFVPVVAGRGVVQVLGYVELLLASLLAVGAVSALGFAQVFYLLPISLFGMSVAAAELPELSRMDQHDRAALLARLQDGLARIAFFVTLAVVAYVAIGDLVVGALLQTGAFGPDETRLVWYVLIAYSGGLLATTAGRLLQNALYAGGDTRRPAAYAAIRVSVAAAAGAVLMLQLDRVVIDGPGLDGLRTIAELPAPIAPLPAGVREAPGPLHLGAAGLALASAGAAWLELTLLRRRVATVIGPVRVGGGQLGRILVAAVAAAAVALVLRPVVGGFHPLLGVALAGPPVALVYGVVSAALGVDEARALLDGAARRLQRPRPHG